MYVCMYVCASACMHTCMCVLVYASDVCMHMSMCAPMYVCMDACLQANLRHILVSAYVRIYTYTYSRIVQNVAFRSCIHPIDRCIVDGARAANGRADYGQMRSRKLDTVIVQVYLFALDIRCVITMPVAVSSSLTIMIMSTENKTRGEDQSCGPVLSSSQEVSSEALQACTLRQAFLLFSAFAFTSRSLELMFE
jgi:hypothetical protein